MERPVGPSFGMEDCILLPLLPRLSIYHPFTGHRQVDKSSFAFVVWGCLGQSWTPTWILPEGTLDGPWGIFPGRLSPKYVPLKF